MCTYFVARFYFACTIQDTFCITPEDAHHDSALGKMSFLSVYSKKLLAKASQWIAESNIRSKSGYIPYSQESKAPLMNEKPVYYLESILGLRITLSQSNMRMGVPIVEDAK